MLWALISEWRKWMCSRFSFEVTEEELRALFGDPRPKGFRVERIDFVSPAEWIVVVKPVEGESVIDLAGWGFIPSWSKDPKDGPQPTCSRWETVATSGMFRKAFKKSRCIIPVRGFYESEFVEGTKRKLPVFFTARTGEVLGLAGICSYWAHPEGWEAPPMKGKPKPDYVLDLERIPALQTASIITVEPNEIVAEVHNRMPVILPRDSWDEWLDPKNEDVERLTRLIKACPSEVLDAVRGADKPEGGLPATGPVARQLGLFDETS